MTFNFLKNLLEAMHAFLLNSFLTRAYCALVVSPKKTRNIVYDGKECLFNIPNSFVNWYVRNFRIFWKDEAQTQGFFLEKIRDNDVVYDVGANIGIYIVWFAKLFSLKQIVAFEPEAGNYSELLKNIGLNKLKNVVALPIAASNRAGYESYYLQDEKEGNNSGFLGDYEQPGRNFISKQTVRLETIDTLVDGGLILSPDVVLIDVDGGELSVLEGMGNSLRKCRIIAVEVSEDTKDDVDRFLTGHNFKLTVKKLEDWRGNQIYENAALN